MSIIKALFKRKEHLLKYLIITSILYILTIEFTYAASSEEIKETIITIANGILEGISVLLGLSTYLVAMFLSPSWTTGALFGLTQYFHDLWILVSNLVYFIFALIIIWIAFMNIVGKTGEQYELKRALPKFIIGILIVPFSWFFVQMLISIAGILTIAGLTLPYEVLDKYDNNNKVDISSIQIPTNCKLNLQSVLGEEGGNDGFYNCTDDKVALIELLNEGDATDSVFSIVSLYTYSILSIDSTSVLTELDAQTIKSLGDLIVKILFDVVFVVVYAILIIAIGIVLMIRGIYLWIFTISSPIFGLMYFLGKKEGGSESFFGKFTLTNFITLALVPVYTMLALSFGFLILFMVSNGLQENEGTNGDIKISNDNTIEIGQFKLEIEGQIGSLDSTTGLGENVGGVIGSLILKIFGIIILWGAVMAALRSSKITETIVEPLHQFGKQVGQIAQQAPGNIPIFPGGQSMSSMSQIANKIGGEIQNKNLGYANKFMDKYGIGGEGAQRTSANQEILNNVRNLNSPNTEEFLNEWKRFLKENQKVENIFSNEKAKELLEEFGKKHGLREDEIKIDSRQSIAETIRLIESKFERGSLGKGALPDSQYEGGTTSPSDIDGLIARIDSSGGSSSSSGSSSSGSPTFNINIDGTNTTSINIPLTDNFTGKRDEIRSAISEAGNTKDKTKQEYINALKDKLNLISNIDGSEAESLAQQIANSIGDVNFK